MVRIFAPVAPLGCPSEIAHRRFCSAPYRTASCGAPRGPARRTPRSARRGPYPRTGALPPPGPARQTQARAPFSANLRNSRVLPDPRKGPVAVGLRPLSVRHYKGPRRVAQTGAVPAEIIPSLPKSGGNAGGFSTDVSSLGISSLSKILSPFFSRSTTGTISARNFPEAVAATTFRWLSAAYSSCFLREMGSSRAGHPPPPPSASP